MGVQLVVVDTFAESIQDQMPVVVVAEAKWTLLEAQAAEMALHKTMEMGPLRSHMELRIAHMQHTHWSAGRPRANPSALAKHFQTHLA